MATAIEQTDMTEYSNAGLVGLDVIELPTNGTDLPPCRGEPNVLAIRLCASDVDRNLARVLKQRVIEELDRGRSKFVLDMTRVQYLDTFAIGTLVSCGRRVNATGGRMTLAELHEDVASLLAVTHVDAVLDVQSKLIDAL